MGDKVVQISGSKERTLEEELPVLTSVEELECHPEVQLAIKMGDAVDAVQGVLGSIIERGDIQRYDEFMTLLHEAIKEKALLFMCILRDNDKTRH